MPVFDLLGAQDFSQSGQRFGGIDGSGRIVRRVDEHRRGSRVQRLFERFEVDLEVFGVGRHYGQVRAGSVDIRLVFREVGGTSSPGLVTTRSAWASAPAAPVVGKM